MSDTNGDGSTEFLDDFREDIRARRQVADDEGSIGLRPRDEVVTEVFLERLEAVLPDMENVSFPRKKLGRANAQLNGYGISTYDGSIALAVTLVQADPSAGGLQGVSPTEVRDAVRAAWHAWEQAGSGIHEQMEAASPATDMFRSLAEADRSAPVRIHVLVEGRINRERAEKAAAEVSGPAAIDVYCLERLERIATSGQSFEELRIDLPALGHPPIPVIRHDHRAVDHEVYLSVIPGVLIADLYHRYGERLLELNVRSFLQAKGKVNRGIRDTIRNEPGYFLAYNNGLTVTAASLEFTPDGGAITAITGLQIVNGGQTSASIHRAWKEDGADLAPIAVQAKITRIDAHALETLVPAISRFSNTQNKVEETDFSANHPLHVGLEQLSRQTWVPGETSIWFYERAKGQWEVARTREGRTKKLRKEFEARCPRNQRIDKKLLARSENSWNQKPHFVSRGGQKNFVEFMDHAGNGEVSAEDYRRIVARVILLRAAEKIARRHAFTAYRANAVTYTVALLSYRTSRGIQLEDVWARQAISEEIEECLHSWMPRVWDRIVERAMERGKNVTEWAKSDKCWADIRGLDVELSHGVEAVIEVPVPTVGGTEVRLTPEDLNRQGEVLAMTPEQLHEIYRQLLTFDDSHGMHWNAWKTMKGVVQTAEEYAVKGWLKIPSPKQTRQVIKARDFLEERGVLPEAQD